MTKLRDMKAQKKKEKAKIDIMGWIKKNKIFIAIIFSLALVALLAYATMQVRQINDSGKKVIVNYYFSNACSVCKSTTPVIEKAANDFGERIELKKKCVTLAEEDNSFCIKEQGLQQYQQNMQEVIALKTKGTPTTLFNEKVVEGGMDEKQVKGEICEQLYGIWGLLDLTGSKMAQCK